MEHQLLLLIVLVAAAGISGQWIAWLSRIPAIVVLLAIGYLLGPVAGVLHPEEQFGALLEPAVSIAVSIIVLEGGLTLNFAELRTAGQGIWRLVAIGFPLVWALGATAAHFLVGLSWPIAVLVGAMLVITGPTVIQPLLREAKLHRRTAAFLKWEGVINDVLGALATVLTLEFVILAGAGQDAEVTAPGIAGGLVLGLLVGGVLGIASAYSLRFLFGRGLAPEFLKPPLVLGVAILIYGISDWVQPESGLLAVGLFGVGLANMGLPEIEELKRFKESLSVFLVSGLFIVVTANLEPDTFLGISWGGVLFIVLAILFIRPTAMMVATIGSDLNWRERLFVGLVAPRGIVVAALASLAGTWLAGSRYEGAGLIVPLVFSIIIATIVLYGFIIGPLARRLNLVTVERPGVIIVGCNPVTKALAQTLRSAEIPVLISDSSAVALDWAEDLGVTVHSGHILAPSDDDAEDLKDFEYLVAATHNDAFNALICQRFTSELSAQNVFQIALQAQHPERVQLNREWRGNILGADHLNLETMERNLEEGWTFRIENGGEAGNKDEKLDGRDTNARLPIALLKENDDIVFASPETDLSGRAPGRLIVFAAPAADAPPAPKSATVSA